MFFAAPINTDAPIEDWPRATLGLIITQVAVFALVMSGVFGLPDDVLDRYSVQYGVGLQPLQWLTSIFLHRGFLHLAGNMFFLWGLGLVVEGKLGWKRFLAVYLTIGVLESAIEQAALSRLQGSSCGSSSILFGLLAMALLWAPRNEITFWGAAMLPPFFRVFTFDLSVQVFGVLALVQEGAMAWWNGFRPASEMMHLGGAALGAGIGWSLLRRGSVDCEGWDLFTLLRNDGPGPALRNSSPLRRPGEVPSQGDATTAARKSLRRIRLLLEDSRAKLAWQQLQETRHWIPGWEPPLKVLRPLADALHSQRHWPEAVELQQEILRRDPEGSSELRLIVSETLIEQLSRPQAALRVLQPLVRETLPKSDLIRVREMEQQAFEMIDAGVMEFDPHRV